LEEVELIPLVTLCHIGDLKPLDPMGAIPFKVPKIKDMLNVFNTVDVPVYIDVIIIGVKSPTQGKVFAHLYS
jgi:hypothetical protein